MTAGWRPSGGSTISEVKPNVRVPHSLRKNVSVVAARVAPVYCWTARARNCSCGSDSWVANACGRSRGMPRMSSVLYVPAMAGSPHDVRGAFQFGFLASAVSCSAGVRRNSGNCAISSAVGGRACCPPGPPPPPPPPPCPRCAFALGGPSPSWPSEANGTDAAKSAATERIVDALEVIVCSPSNGIDGDGVRGRSIGDTGAARDSPKNSWFARSREGSPLEHANAVFSRSSRPPAPNGRTTDMRYTAVPRC